jgi:enamine deaminase RidA (YjgF/YER057c/UK114 family)
MGPRERLAELGIELPTAPTPVASYVPVRVSGDLVFLSGQVPLEDGQPILVGTVGRDLTVEQGAEAARRCALQTLAAIDQHLGLDRVAGIVKVTVFVASAGGFTDQPKVANGASDLFVEVFGDAGKHARSAVSSPSLPLGVPVEVETVAELVSS